MAPEEYNNNDSIEDAVLLRVSEAPSEQEHTQLKEETKIIKEKQKVPQPQRTEEIDPSADDSHTGSMRSATITPGGDGAAATTSTTRRTLQVIGTSFGRTGTNTLKAALDTLGYKTYHIHEVYDSYYPEHYPKWNYLVKHRCRVPDARQIIEEMLLEEGYNAIVGISSNCVNVFFELYPNAKYIHTERASAEEWYHSVATTICVTPTMPMFRLGIMLSINVLVQTEEFLTTMVLGYWLQNPPNVSKLTKQVCIDHKQKMIQSYNNQLTFVKKTIPPHQLLVLHNNYQDGWTPLCEFLNKPIPSSSQQPFPHVLKNAKFDHYVITTITRLIYNPHSNVHWRSTSFVSVASTFGVILYFVKRIFQQQRKRRQDEANSKKDT